MVHENSSQWGQHIQYTKYHIPEKWAQKEKQQIEMDQIYIVQPKDREREKEEWAQRQPMPAEWEKCVIFVGFASVRWSLFVFIHCSDFHKLST